MTHRLPMAAMLLAAALAPAWGQVKPMTPPPAPAAAAPAANLRNIEKNFDLALQTAGVAGPIQLRGFTRGLQLSDYGAVFTAEVDLVATPTINIFQSSISPEQAQDVHQRKLTNLTALRKSMRETIGNTATALTSLLPEGRIVVAVRLLYQSWENRAGLPACIVMKGTRGAILAGNVEVEDQQ
jgi:hypothetical protein